MNSNNLIEIYKNGNLVIPIYLLKNYEKFNVSLEEFVFLMYLNNIGNNFLFDPNKYSNELNMKLPNVLTIIDSLNKKGLIKIDVLKNDKGIMDEVVILDGFYNKLSFIMIDKINDKKEDINNSDIFSILEHEFGRSLTPIELEISKAWLTNGIKEELIKEAIKEAVYNHVVNLKYIDKILYEWSKNGIKNIKDVEDNRRKRINRNNDDSNIDIEDIEWNWFEDEE